MKPLLWTQICVFIMTMIVVKVRSSPDRVHCSDPDTFPSLEWEEYAQIIQQQSRGLLFGDDFRGHAPAHSNVMRHHIHQDRHSEDSNMMALCRSKLVSSIDNLRKPERLIERTCVRTVVFSGGRIFLCRPLSHRVNVLRRGPCLGGTWTYERVWETLHIGCAAYIVRAVDQGNLGIFADH